MAKHVWDGIMKGGTVIQKEGRKEGMKEREGLLSVMKYKHITHVAGQDRTAGLYKYRLIEIQLKTE